MQDDLEFIKSFNPFNPIFVGKSETSQNISYVPMFTGEKLDHVDLTAPQPKAPNFDVFLCLV